MLSGMTTDANTTRPEHTLIFHIGPEIVECLMRKPNPAESKQKDLEKCGRVKSSGESHSPVSRVARDPWSAETLASVLLLALRWLL